MSAPELIYYKKTNQFAPNEYELAELSDAIQNGQLYIRYIADETLQLFVSFNRFSEKIYLSSEMARLSYVSFSKAENYDYTIGMTKGTYLLDTNQNQGFSRITMSMTAVYALSLGFTMGRGGVEVRNCASMVSQMKTPSIQGGFLRCEIDPDERRMMRNTRVRRFLSSHMYLHPTIYFDQIVLDPQINLDPYENIMNIPKFRGLYRK